MKQKVSFVYVVIIALVVAAGGFWAGMKYQQSQGRGGNGGRRFQSAGGGRNGGNTPVVGEIISQDANSVTVKLQDGSSKIVNVAASTTISKTDTGSKTDLKTGARIAAFGTTNSDGSITAQNIQLNPMFRMGRRNL